MIKSKNVCIMKKLTLILALLIWLVACNKAKQEEPNNSNTTTSASCGTNQGEFEIILDGINHVMTQDSSTQFTIFYNYYNPNINDFVIYSKDQNGKDLSIEAMIPNQFTVGTQTYDNSNVVDFFDIDLDTNAYYVSSVTFNITESTLNNNQGPYTPIKGTFNGLAHSYPWSNGQPPIDSLNFSGSFCLNGYILQ